MWFICLRIADESSFLLKIMLNRVLQLEGMTGMQNSVVSLSINFIFLNKRYLKDNLLLNFLQWKDFKKKILLFTFLCIKLKQNFLSALNK